MADTEKNRVRFLSENVRQNRLRYADFLAVVVLAITAVLLIDSVRYSVQVPDECAYLTLTQRLMKGDRLLIDEWHITQLTALFQYLPFRCFLAVTGGTEGIVLALRYLFVAVKLVFFCFIYGALREYHAWAVLCAVVFTGYNAIGFLTLNYYSMGYMALLAVLILFLLKQKNRPHELLFIGFIYACAVWMQPFAAILFFVYSGIVLVRHIGMKKGKELFSSVPFAKSRRSWCFLTAGILMCALPCSLSVFAGVDLHILFQNVAEVFADSEYDFLQPGNVMRSEKIMVFFHIYGFVIPGVSWGAFFLTAAFRKKMMQYREIFCPICVGLSVAALVMLFFADLPYRYYAFVFARPIFITNTGLVCYLFTKNRDRKLLEFLLIGLLLSLIQDVGSEITICNASILSAVPAVLMMATLYSEIRAEKEDRSTCKTVKRSAGVMAALLIVFVIGEGWNYYLVRSIHIVESYKVGSSAELSETLKAGPLCGIVTIPEISRKYDAALSDMDLIKKETAGFFYVAGECPWYYLYVDHPYGTYTTYYVGSDSHAKTLRYWQMFPEKRPSCIYVPFFDTSDYKTDLKRAQDELRYFKSLCDFEITEGKAGYILKNISWK